MKMQDSVFRSSLYQGYWFEKLIGGTKLENCFNQNVHFFKAAFRMTLVKKNCQSRERSPFGEAASEKWTFWLTMLIYCIVHSLLGYAAFTCICGNRNCKRNRTLNLWHQSPTYLPPRHLLILRWIYTVSVFRTFLSVFLRFCFLKKYALFYPHFYKSISALTRQSYTEQKFSEKNFL